MNPQTASALPGQEQWFPSFKPSAKGGEVTVFSGPKSGVKEQVIVWTPEGYDPQDRSKTYNVLEFIHGYPGSPVSVARALDFSGTLQKAIDQGEIAPTIVVIPEGNVNLKAPTCANVQRGAQTATWLSFDIPKMIRSVFPNVSDNRQDWMIAGNSSGAYCAARLGVLYGDVFGASGVLSGYDQPIVGNWGVRSGKTFQDNTLSSLISRPRPWTLDMYVFGAQLDRESIHIAKAFSAAQLAPGDRLQLNVKAEGGHNWATWRDQMPDLYRWWQQIRTTKAPKVSQILGADSALIPQKKSGSIFTDGFGGHYCRSCYSHLGFGARGSLRAKDNGKSGACVLSASIARVRSCNDAGNTGGAAPYKSGRGVLYFDCRNNSHYQWRGLGWRGSDFPPALTLR